MRKIYSLVLLATALLIGTNVWAEDGVIEIVRNGVTLQTTYNHLKDAFAAAQDGDILQLTGDVTENETKAAWLGEVSSGSIDPNSPDYYANNDRSVTLDLKGHTYYNSGARYVIALTRGELRIKSTGGEGEIKLKKHGIIVYGTYLKIDAKTETPFSHLVIDENVKITEGEKSVVLADLHPGEVVRPSSTSTSNWNWDPEDTYPVDYRCDIFPNSQWGIANGARIDIYGKVESTEYACQVNGNVRSALEFLNLNDGSYITPYYYKYSSGTEKQIHFPLYWKKSDTELYLPGTTMDGKTEETVVGAWTTAKAYYDSNDNDDYNDYVLTLNDNNYAPYVHIHKSAVLKTNNPNEKSAVGFYSAGYSRVYIEGTCEGSTGLYVKSGDVELHDATITSNYSGDYAEPNPTGSGVDAGGSGIVIESNKGYTGNIDASVTGDTYVEGSTGYAIDEVVTNAPTTDVDIISIEGGTFVGGDEGTIKISEETADANEQDPDDVQIIIAGGNMTNNGVEIGNSDLETFLDSQTNDTHVTTVTVDGKTTLIVSQGDAPAEDPDNVGNTTWAYIASQSNAATLPSYAWTKVEADEIASGTVYLGELQIISGSENNLQQLTINSGATLQVNHLIMNDYARIIVEAGGKLIVKGTLGIVAPQVENIVLKASESAQATFLFHPNVTSNRHPNAKVEYHSNSFYSDHNVQQFFGVPTYNGAVSNIETESTAAIYFDVWRNPGWDYIGAMNVPVTPSDPSVLANLDKFDLPFGLYCITSKNDADHKPVFTFSGKLTGNLDHNFTLHQGWTSMANAYTGPIDKNAIVAKLAAWNASYGTEQSVYTYDLNESTGAIQWHARSKYALPTNGINAMQPIMFHNGSKVEGVVLDYSDLVWDPFVAANPSAAPARQAISNITKAQINIAGENEADYATIVADSELGDDRSFCAPKYNNAGLQLYVMGNEKYDVYAADEIESSYIGFRTVNAGMYTISFENVEGEDLVLVDLVNGARTNMAEGAIYTFHAGANETNDYRFQVVAAAKMPTSIENTEAQSTKKAGVYTLTGQYLGNASIFNALPAGVYVVDGVKKVK